MRKIGSRFRGECRREQRERGHQRPAPDSPGTDDRLRGHAAGHIALMLMGCEVSLVSSITSAPLFTANGWVLFEVIFASSST